MFWFWLVRIGAGYLTVGLSFVVLFTSRRLRDWCLWSWEGAAYRVEDALYLLVGWPWVALVISLTGLSELGERLPSWRNQWSRRWQDFLARKICD